MIILQQCATDSVPAIVRLVIVHDVLV